MGTGGHDDDAGSGGEAEEESAEAKIERLATEIDELKASLIGVPEASDEWFQIKTDIKDRDGERLVLMEKKRCDDAVKEYFEENPHVLEAVPECPICFERMWDASVMMRYVCCGKLICKKCYSQARSVFDTCPLCRGKAPGPDKTISMTKEKADSGIAWAQAYLGQKYLYGNNGLPKDVEKALPLLSEAAENGSTDAKFLLGNAYIRIGKYEEARRWHEAAAAEGEIQSLFKIGMMMSDGRAFDQNEQTRSEALRLITISAKLHEGSFNMPALELSRFFGKSNLPVKLHYLRPAVEGGDAGAMDDYALGLVSLACVYYGTDSTIISRPGYCPIPEALFWHRRTKDPHANHLLAQFERTLCEYCAHCRAILPDGKQSHCAECKAAYYCGRDCQVAHWQAGHKKDCVRKLKKRLRAEGKLEEDK